MNSASKPAPHAEAEAIGEAIRRIRERMGLTQSEMAEKAGTTQQTWQRWEAGARPKALLKRSVLDQISAAFGISYDDLMDERDNVVGFPGVGVQRRPQPAQEAYRIPMGVNAGVAEDGPLAYDAQDDGQLDLSWLFNPNTGSLRVVGDVLTGFAESGQTVVYDRTSWASKGQGCVVELKDGRKILGFYERTANSTVTISQANSDEHLTYPLANIKGVWAIRARVS